MSIREWADAAGIRPPTAEERGQSAALAAFKATPSRLWMREQHAAEMWAYREAERQDRRRSMQAGTRIRARSPRNRARAVRRTARGASAPAEPDPPPKFRRTARSAESSP